MEKNQIENLYLDTFDDNENKLVAKLATDLLKHKDTYTFVEDRGEQIIGHIAFSPIFMQDIDNKAYILAPLAVLPKYQHQGIGTKLVTYGIEVLKNLNTDFILVYGDPNYYARFGFKITHNFIPNYPLSYPDGLQVLALNDYKMDTRQKVIFDCVGALNNQHLW